jgi:biopolymer transport protein ExbD
VADISTTPLIDVMLVLLVMLISSIPIPLHSVNLHLPVGTPTLPPELHVRPDGHARYYRFAEVMGAVQRAGLVKVGVVGSEKFQER